MKEKVVHISAIQKMVAAAEKGYEVERKAEADPKLKAKVKVQEMAKKCIEEINEILLPIRHLIKTDDGKPIEFEIVTDAELKKPGKVPGTKFVQVVKNPHTGEVIEITGSGKNISVPEKYFEWRQVFGVTSVAKWLESQLDDDDK
ncbi:hypothetical protein F3I62_19125 [Pseudomonas sp. R-28-1W-6]|uniref:hypothetical protein n=1 Tax=Pseudomonas sp. R-28-1W-6 TaxID=2650101 RepID=UPI00136583EB|nr:hypothetical protein [Pseudomonas sp. R-28-1W-6]MWV14219.1 hypothetical protein [Pseudomonas sp. R-28-1W-6]